MMGMKHLFLLLPVIVLCLSLPLRAEDRPIEGAGEAFHTTSFETQSKLPYVDIYARRLDYKDARDDLRSQIEQRRDHYNAARSEVLRGYTQDWDRKFEQ